MKPYVAVIIVLCLCAGPIGGLVLASWAIGWFLWVGMSWLSERIKQQFGITGGWLGWFSYQCGYLCGRIFR